jgi:hypothetical protein
MTSPPNKSNPMGFHKMALIKSPPINAIIDRVAPQDGQGIPVVFLSKQTGPTTFAHLWSRCIKSHE